MGVCLLDGGMENDEIHISLQSERCCFYNVIVCTEDGWMERSRRMEWKRRRTNGVERDSRNVPRMEINLDFCNLYTCKIYILQTIHRCTHTCTHFEQSHLEYIKIYIDARFFVRIQVPFLFRISVYLAYTKKNGRFSSQIV